MATPLIILGAGGDGQVLLDLVADLKAPGPAYRVTGFLDDAPERWGQTVNGVPVLGPLARAAEYDTAKFAVCIGSPASFWRRAAIVEALGLARERFATIVHPSAKVARNARLGAGVVIYPHAAVLTNAHLGDFVALGANSVVNHDCVVGDHTLLAAGVILSGRVQVASRCYLGTGAQVIQDATIGEASLVGMGSVVLGPVPANCVVVGNPARFLRHTVAQEPAAT